MTASGAARHFTICESDCMVVLRDKTLDTQLCSVAKCRIIFAHRLVLFPDLYRALFQSYAIFEMTLARIQARFFSSARATGKVHVLLLHDTYPKSEFYAKQVIAKEAKTYYDLPAFMKT